jgi:ABC-type multidrug transport system permease subunit
VNAWLVFVSEQIDNLLTRFLLSFLALMVGALFWGLGDRDDYESIISRAAVLFYCVSFFIFMSVAVLPFTVMERAIVDKEVANKYYHPISYQVAQAIASIPGAAVLAFLVSVIIIHMLKFKDPGWYFLNMFLALTTSEALAQMVSHIVPHFVIGMALIAGMFGFFMLFQGFMLVPSDFPPWLRWTNKIAFHTYSWRTFMVTEFRGEEFSDATFPTGEDVLKFYEIEDTDRGHDVSSFVYSNVIHVLWVLYVFILLISRLSHAAFNCSP